MKLSILKVVLISALLVGCATHRPDSGQLLVPLSPGQWTTLEDAAHWTYIQSARNLPPEIIAFAGKNGLADPGQEFNTGDTWGIGVPAARLVWAANNGDLYVVNLETGSLLGASASIFLFALPPGGKPQTLWRGDGAQFPNYPVVLRALKRKPL